MWITLIFGSLIRVGASDEPLFLTPLLDAGNITSARNQARVTPDIGGVESYAGYLTVDKACQSNLFFWYFPALKKRKKAPVGVWLQGGPGSTSLIGLFEEIGIIVFNGTLHKRIDTWNTVFHLVFIDQPVGTGFSFTGNGCYAKNKTDVSKNLYSGIEQFFKLFPELQPNSFYLMGQSYAGHYIPAVGSFIHNANTNATTKINMKGLMIGNGLMDSFYQANYGSYLSALGLLDNTGKARMDALRATLVQQINLKNWTGAQEAQQSMTRLYVTTTGLSEYDFTRMRDNSSVGEPWTAFVDLPEVRKAIHVGDNNFSYVSTTVNTNLLQDIPQSLKPEVEELLAFYKVIFYAGQLDVILAYPMMVSFLEALQWDGASAYKNATRQRWCVDGEVAGFWKEVGNLVEMHFRNAGHFVPKDQPFRSLLFAASAATTPSNNSMYNLTTC